jgi:hypothetical protein
VGGVAGFAGIWGDGVDRAWADAAAELPAESGIFSDLPGEKIAHRVRPTTKTRRLMREIFVRVFIVGI